MTMKNLLYSILKFHHLKMTSGTRQNMTEKCVVVDTEYGPVRGIRKETCLGVDFISFQGIPYMKAPIGDLKFRDAQPPEVWTEPLDATKEGPAFCQFDELTVKTIGELDAMFVNVFTKDVDPKKPFPVMVYIHGGGYVNGSSTTDFYTPDFLLQKDVIMVSMQYRLGVFGFLSLEDPELGIPGNAGFKDQTFALKWVKRNIQKFGGDPNNITIFGESNGGGAVHYHSISEHSKGLFNRVIATSGCAFNKVWTCYPRRNFNERIAKNAGWNGTGGEKGLLEFFENADPFTIVEATDRTLTEKEKFQHQMMFAIGPTIEPYITENCFIPEDPVLMARDAWGNDIDILIGGNSNEGTVIIFYSNTYKDPLEKFFTNFYNNLPLELSVEPGSDESLKYGKMLKKLYCGCTEPSSRNLQGFFHFVADVQFWNGLQRAILSRTNSNGNGKTFLFRFDADSFVSFKQLDERLNGFPGASHGDDIQFYFKTLFNNGISVDSKEFQLVKQMVSILTNFAATGNPNVPELGENMNWEPVSSTKLPLTALNITLDSNQVIELPESERMQVWSEIYEQQNCPFI